MNLREPCLPRGWYPDKPEEIKDFLKNFNTKGSSVSAIAPHAGWYYSGRTAARSFSSLDKNAETAVIIGGHLAAAAPCLFAEEDGVKTPFGTMEIDAELKHELKKKISSASDHYRDNTVEVLLPMAHYFFPNAKLLWIRFPAALSSFEAGKILAECAENQKKNIAVIGSTDLTHYGDNYDFFPKGRGINALNWVKNENDANFIKAVLKGDPEEVLFRAENDFSACSAGAVLGAMGFAEAKNCLNQAKLLEYSTSAGENAKIVPDSFVGYASISF